MRVVQPARWQRATGYSNGIAGTGEVLFVAGQIGWNEDRRIVSADFVDQARAAMRNVIEVVHAAGGSARNIARMTWFVTNADEYRHSTKALGAAYRELFGDHYPAMTLVQVAALLEDGAKVEIEATALL